MNEVSELVAFLRSGKREEILLEDYLVLQSQKKGWRKKRESVLLNQLEKSKVVSMGYKQIDTKLKKNLKLNK